MFQVGQRVRCINHSLSDGILERGGLHTIAEVSGDHVRIDQGGFFWFASRFVPVAHDPSNIDEIAEMFSQF